MRVERCGRAMMAPPPHAKGGAGELRVAPDGLDDSDVWAAPLNVQEHHPDHSNNDEESIRFHVDVWSMPWICLFCYVFDSTRFYQRELQGSLMLSTCYYLLTFPGFQSLATSCPHLEGT
jgi:hypothetical protein